MRIVHVDLRSVDGEYVDLRYGGENLNDFEPRRLAIADIQDVIDLVERDYSVSLPEDYAKTGRRLYDWLDGSDRFLSNLIRSQSVVLAIATSERLAHLPWEILHDGQGFLVGRSRPVVPVRWQAQGAGDRLTWTQQAPQNRPLQMLFMATSPAGVEPVLDFEAEEGQILTATEQQPLALVVEESGCLEELANLLTSYDRDYFDVVHLSGHAQISEAGPRFITETETGDRFDASADEIAEAFEFNFPALMFLSGCRTGESGRGRFGSQQAGEVPSMAAALLAAGAEAVLGWGRPVRDVDGILAAETLYSKLSAAKTLPEALALTYRAMIKAKARDWHLLRLYVSGSLARNLVTSKNTPGRAPALKPSMAETFLDAARRVKVPDRKSFVGRRRPLQDCLRALRDPSRTGVLLHGMGGLGKSSLAARLCDRLQTFERVVLFGPLDEAELVSQLAQRIRRNSELQQYVQNPNEDLKYRLRDLFEAQATPFLLVLDDFEANLEAGLNFGGQGFRVKAVPAAVLGALMWAIEATERGHRVVMTCRYDFEFGGLSRIYKQPLARLQQADLDKKCRQLGAFGEKSAIEAELRERALGLADGNPRLLEWLDKVLRHPEALGEGSVVAVLDKIAAEPEELHEQVLAAVLVQQIDAPMREMLERAMVYELPVPRAAIVEVYETENCEGLIDRAVALGLLEESPDGALRVPRVLGFGAAQSAELAGQAAEVLYRLWWEAAESSSEAQKLEIHRLAVKGEIKEIASMLADKLSMSWNSRGRFRETVALCEKTLISKTDHRVLMRLAWAQDDLGEKEKSLASYRQALEECPDDDLEIKASILHNTAVVLMNQGDVDGAIALFQQSLEIKEQIGDVQGKAATLHQLAILKANQGDVDGAITLYQQSLEITEQIGDVKTKAATLHNLADLKANQGDVDGAITLYQQSLEIKEQIGNVQGKAATLHQLAILKANQGDVDGAIALFQQSLEIKEQIGDVQGKAATLAMLGQLLADKKGDTKTAISYLQDALSILQQLRSPDAQTVQDILNRILEQPSTDAQNKKTPQAKESIFKQVLKRLGRS